MSSSGMSIGREVDPLAAAALPAVVSERVLQPHAPRVDRQAARVQQHLDRVEPVQHHGAAATGR